MNSFQRLVSLSRNSIFRLLLLCALIGQFSFAASMDEKFRRNILIETDELGALIDSGDPDLILVHAARIEGVHPNNFFFEQRIPGSVMFLVDEIRSYHFLHAGPMLPEAKQFSFQMQHLGIRKSGKIVVYD